MSGASNYPGALDLDAQLRRVSISDAIFPSDHNNIVDAVESIEAFVGAKPGGWGGTDTVVSKISGIGTGTTVLISQFRATSQQNYGTTNRDAILFQSAVTDGIACNDSSGHSKFALPSGFYLAVLESDVYVTGSDSSFGFEVADTAGTRYMGALCRKIVDGSRYSLKLEWSLYLSAAKVFELHAYTANVTFQTLMGTTGPKTLDPTLTFFKLN
jgi:hypothetical protein